jgi:hypothetical protein
MPVYTTITDFRDATQMNQTEYSNNAVTKAIERMTNRIDEMTERTWQKPKTETDILYDGDGTDLLYLRHTDIQTLSAISIRESTESTSTHTTVTTNKVAVYPEGYIVLYSDAEVANFTAGIEIAKLTYIHGATRQTAIDDADGISDSDTTVTVDSTTGFPDSGTIVIESEWIDYTGKTSTTLTGLSRGAHGTTAAAHSNNVAVYEAAPPEVQDLCILMIQNFLKHELERKQVIDSMVEGLKWKGPLLS